MEQEPDEVLIEKSRAGDQAAFKTLVVQYEGKVAGVVRTLLGATPEAEDVGQEVFIRFYNALHKFRGDASLSTYLVKIAINLALTELRKDRKLNARMTSLEDANQVQATEDQMDLRQQLQYELSRMEPEFKSVVTLRLVEGYTTEETASLLDIPVGTVLSRLARAQHKLRTALSKKLK